MEPSGIIASIYQVVEKVATPDRRFIFQRGIWHPTLDTARSFALTIAPFSLAHRMFITGPRNNVVEVIYLAPYAMRERYAHLSTMAVKNPDKLKHELNLRGLPPNWLDNALVEIQMAAKTYRLPPMVPPKERTESEWWNEQQVEEVPPGWQKA